VNNFARIKPITQYRKVSYYSVSMNDSEISLFEEFVVFHGKQNREKLQHVLSWIQTIGDKYGAQNHLFRSEAFISDTAALPPNGKDRKPCFNESGEAKANNLRLYCLRANEHVVFLFNGDVKTANKAQKCPNVKEHFLLANQLTKVIDEAFKEGEIQWNDDLTLLIYSNDLKLYL